MIDTEVKIDIQLTENYRLSEIEINNVPFGRVFSDHMFIAEYDSNGWGNAKIIPHQRLLVNPASHGLNYGQSLFEGMKAYKGQNGEPQLFRPLDNHKRLCKTAKRMCMPEIPEELFMSALNELVGLDRDWIPDQEGSALYLRPLYFADDDYIGVKASNKFKFIIITCPVGPYYAEPVNVLVSIKYIRACKGGMGQYKAAGNYAPTLLPAKEANEKGYHNMLWMNAENPKLLEEIGTMNVFVVIGDEVITPILNGNILEGITRNSILQLLKDRDYNVSERELSIDEVAEAYHNGNLKEAFGAGTAASITHIAKIGYNGKDIILPPIEDRPISNMLADVLCKIKTSREPDPHGWVYKIPL
ncbi:MAG: branched chain amino acid aminotransferase [Bacteroidetes bacterium]|nr:branched-chain amino acid aminotransferase [Bacteroidia bacterium]PCH66622.1 MAG: branched chain amino acid aminotransferase [Bacteroidota bacterium]